MKTLECQRCWYAVRKLRAFGAEAFECGHPGRLRAAAKPMLSASGLVQLAVCPRAN